MLLPARMVWADLLVDRDSVELALETLASLEVIELGQPHTGSPSFPVVLEPDEKSLGRLTALEHELQPFSDFLPSAAPPNPRSNVAGGACPATLPELEKGVGDWLLSAKPLIDKLRNLDTRLEELNLLVWCLESIPDIDLDLRQFALNGAALAYPGFIAIGNEESLESVDELRADILFATHAHPGQPHDRVVMVGVCPADRLARLESRLHARHWRFVRIPEELSGPGRGTMQSCRRLIDRERCRYAATRNELDEVCDRFGIVGLRAVLQRHIWVHNALTGARLGERFAWLCGWVPEARLDELVDHMQSAGVPFLLNKDAAAGHGPPPALLQNPRWARRFEAFVDAFGLPEADEIDPSPVLAVTMPLMFGYMFGDLGHGAVLVLVGLWARRQLPVLALLVPAGLSSMLFGVLFGSVFCIEHVFPPLWVTPMQEPLLILAVPVAFGLCLILLSLVLNAVQEARKDRLAEWWIFRFPAVLSFIALCGGLLDRRALLVAAAGAIWLLVARSAATWNAKGPRGALAAPLTTLAELIETLLQLFVNTLSFTRLGAFALAHAGLGMAVIILAGMPESAPVRAAIFVAGNALVIALEGLVVSIQTTRLVMFEFFRRFLGGGGRAFRPLRLPGRDDGAVA